MNLISVLVGFLLIIILNSKKVDIGIAFLVGSLTIGILSDLKFMEILSTFYQGTIDPLTLQLMVIVTIISGLGYLLKQTGDLDLMIDSLINIFKNSKILSMLIPAIFGTLAVPGGAILSAPILSENADRINIKKHKKTSINLFFRHIGYLIYPLYSALIIAAKLFEVEKFTFLKYNFIIMVVGILTAYFVFFSADRHQEDEFSSEDDKTFSQHLRNLTASFSPILIIIILVIGFSIPFHWAVFSGLLIGLIRNLPSNNKIKIVWQRLRNFFTEGVKYKLILVVAGIMIFKSIVEATGAVNAIAEMMTASGIPLSLMILILGFLVGFLTGVESASIGILIPIFLPFFPANNPGPFIALLFTCSFCGYLVSPIHLCLVLTKEFFESRYFPVYRYLALPVLAMIATAFVQYFVF